VKRATVAALWAAVLLAGVIAGCSRRDPDLAGDFRYRIESGGVPAGYAVVDTQLVEEDGETWIHLLQRNHFESRAMGSDMETDTRLEYLLAPDGKRVRRHQGEASAGTNSARWAFDITDGRVRGTSSLKGDSLALDLPPDAIVENTLFYDHLVADFAGTDLAEKIYPVLDLADFVVRDTRYRKSAGEEPEPAGDAVDVLVLDRTVEATGASARLWIDTATGLLVKYVEQDGITVSLADASVADRIRPVNLDRSIFSRTNVAIADVPGITYMKVRARVRPTGLRPTPETLNVPGQTFTGTVEDNVIDGVFEIQHLRYDGAGAPAFPLGKVDPALQADLAADAVYEADDEVLGAKAREITAGAADAWEAATRLATWVSGEIGYAVPGGGTARRTYDLRAGECGGHSVLLATFCRAVGIPARMVWGCMYTPDRGGSFGQHGWTEVHMGRAGWIPVDATAGETDFVDSGHLRVAPYGSFYSRLNAREFEILDYRVEGGGEDATEAARRRYQPYLGRYRHTDSPLETEIKVLDGGLVLDIPGRTLLALEEPREGNRWVCKLTDRAYVTFDRKDGSGEVEAFTLHEVQPLPRRDDPDESATGAPEEIAAYPGRYYLAALDADVRLVWKRSRLVLVHPEGGRTFTLETAGEDGTSWKTRKGPYTVSFVTGPDGRVASMHLETANRFKRS